MTPLHATLGILATYRATKLVIDDEIAAELREKAFSALDRHPDSILAQKLTYFLGCPWCVSIWIGAALSALYAFDRKTYDIVVQTLGFSAATGLIYSHLD